MNWIHEAPTLLAMAGTLVAIGSVLAQGDRQAVPDSTPMETLEQQFRDVPMEARRLTGPLFWMHGDESKEKLEGELAKVLEGHNGIFTTEPRPHKDWLGEGWYRDVGICLDYARKHNLLVVIYDDWWWPSQMMGGRVPPQYGSKRIQASAVTLEGPKKVGEAGYGDTNLIAIVAGKVVDGDAVDAKSLVDLTAKVGKDGTLAWDAPAGQWRLMKFTWQFNGSRGGQQRHISVDGASPDCVAWFINTVYQPHYDRFKDDFGKTIIGYFYDEPETQGDWGSDVPKLIAERKQDLKTLLVAYKFKLAGEDQVAGFYAYLDAFAESWGRTMYGGMTRWCREHKVISTGHFMEHGGDIFSRGLSAGNMMLLQKYSDIGGIDLVCGQVYPGQRNMGVYQMPKIASSVSHTYNKENDVAFSETFGGYNQGLTYPQMKWLTDWQQLGGVNYLVPHSFNPRAPHDRDYPPYFYNGGFEPRWPLYRVWADYNNRLSLMLTGGRHVAPVAFLHVGLSYHLGAKQRPEELTSSLQDALYDCDWLNYDAWENDSKLNGKTIKLHKEEYRVLVMPAAEVIPYPTLAKAKAFFDNGGVVVGYGMLPSKSATLGRYAKDIAELREAIWGAAAPGLTACKTSPAGGRSYFLPTQPSPEDLQKVLAGDAGIRPTLEVVKGDTGHWLHVLHRQRSGRDVFLVCNQAHEGAARPFTFRVTAAGEPECWDPMRNEITSVPCRRIDTRTVEVDVTLEPSESVMLVFQAKKRALPARLDSAAKPLGDPIPVVRDTTVVAKDDEPPPYPLKDCSWVWAPEGNAAKEAPAGSVTFRGRLTIPPDRKIKAARFVITADNSFTLFVNGKQAGTSAPGDASWSTPATLDLSKHLVAGPNRFAIVAVNSAPGPAGLIGRVTVEFEQGPPLTETIDGAWKASAGDKADWARPDFDDSAWKAAKVVAAYGAAPWGVLGPQGGRGVRSPVVDDTFVGKVEIPAGVDLAASRVYLDADELAPEAAASVSVNDQFAGGFIGKPFRLDVTALLRPGANRIRIAPFTPKTIRLLVYPKR